MTTRTRRVNTNQTIDDILIEVPETIENLNESLQSEPEVIEEELIVQEALIDTITEELVIQPETILTPVIKKSRIKENKVQPIVKLPIAAVIDVILLAKDVIEPTYNFNEGCFDIAANFTNVRGVSIIKVDDTKNIKAVSVLNIKNRTRGIILEANERALIPTNMKFVLPLGYKMHLYSKSNLSFNNGVKLTAGVDTIHSSYTGPLFIAIKNDSNMRRVIMQGDVIAQAEIVPNYIAKLNVTN